MVARRLGAPDGSPAATTETFTVDGERIRGVAGEPVAVALLAADRLVLSRSFRFHRPRGLMCDTGQCCWCEVEIDGVPSVRSCQVGVRDGLSVRSEHAWPTARRDLFGLLDLGSRFIPPTFYHHRFLRPRQLRKRYLDVIRAFGGRGNLPKTASTPRGRSVRELDVDVLVVGGGRSGVAAANAEAAAGRTVVLVETVRGRAEPEPGVRVLDGATAIGWYDGVVTAIDEDTLWTIRAPAVVAATGSYERVPTVRGADRPGMIGARRALDLLVDHRVVPGERPLLVGAEGELTEVAAAFRGAGAAPVATVPTAALRRVFGRDRVTGADVERGGRRERLATDVVVFADRTPNLDLLLAAGAAVERVDGVLRPVVDPDGRTSVAGLRAVGAAAGRGSGAGGGRDVAPPARAVVCFCEDVHADELRAQVGAGYADPELVKRRTGALTGPCQGKYCLQAFSCALATAGVEAVPPTARPPLRPVRLGDLVPAADPAPE